MTKKQNPMNLKKARDEGKLEDFIREREERDTDKATGDAAKLKALSESMARGEETKKPKPETSPLDSAGS